MIVRHGIRNTKNGSWEAFFTDQDGVEIIDGPYWTPDQTIREHDASVDLLFGDSELYYNASCDDVQLTPERMEDWL